MSDKSPDEIEREIEAERGELARSLDALQNRFSPEAMVETASGLFREHGGAFADGAVRQAKANPIALALTGVGLAWLIAGPSRPTAGTYDRWDATHDIESFRDTYGRPDPVGTGSDEETSGFVHRDRMPASRTQLEPAAHTPKVAYDDREYEPVHGFRRGPNDMGGFDDRLARASGDYHEPTLRDRVTGAARSARTSLSSAGRRIGGAVPSFGRSQDDYGYMRDYDDGSNQSFVDRLKEGTENMTDAARDRVIAARQAAYNAQRNLDDHARAYVSQGRDAYGEHPLVGGLIAFGLGAMIGAALPRTRQEDAYLGSYRDRALEEAERIYHAESAKLQEVARAAAEEAKAAASETLNNAKEKTPTGEEAMDRAEGAAKSTAERVKNAAEEEAEKQNLGGSVS
ncbi:DUF3618 domain-containing protein [uncultured Jannaschia sp.]|uniref:DUF3618 domain-containing protein n=1 Tax=uncultured Jannaschia sp. TaxID=293347 RepID=UPI0026192D23|nr:DUF3618 domain-containing protein [uncultured Jannaschia sp.]